MTSSLDLGGVASRRKLDDESVLGNGKNKEELLSSFFFVGNMERVDDDCGIDSPVKERGAVENAEAPTTSRQDAATDFIMVEVACCVERVEEDPQRSVEAQK